MKKKPSKEFLKLPMKERRRILRKQAAKLLKAMPDYGKDAWDPYWSGI